MDLTSTKKELITKYKESKDKVKRAKLAEVEASQAKLKSVDRSLGIRPQRTQSAARAGKDLHQELGDWRREKEDKESKIRQEQLALDQAEKAK